MLARRAASGLPPTAYSQRPQTSRVVRSRREEREPEHDEDRVGQPADRAAAERLHDRRHARDQRPVRGPEREPSHDAERRQRDDERVRHPPVDIDSPFAAPTASPVPRIASDDEHARARVAVDDRPDDARERDRRADGEVDPARDDHEQLAEREHRDHRRLREDVADVAAREEDGGRQADRRRSAGTGSARAPPAGRRAPAEAAVAGSTPSRPGPPLRVGRRHRHLDRPPRSRPRPTTGPAAGTRTRSSDSGSISML